MPAHIHMTAKLIILITALLFSGAVACPCAPPAYLIPCDQLLTPDGSTRLPSRTTRTIVRSGPTSMDNIQYTTITQVYSRTITTTIGSVVSVIYEPVTSFVTQSTRVVRVLSLTSATSTVTTNVELLARPIVTYTSLSLFTTISYDPDPSSTRTVLTSLSTTQTLILTSTDVSSIGTLVQSFFTTSTQTVSDIVFLTILHNVYSYVMLGGTETLQTTATDLLIETVFLPGTQLVTLTQLDPLLSPIITQIIPTTIQESVFVSVSLQPILTLDLPITEVLNEGLTVSLYVSLTESLLFQFTETNFSTVSLTETTTMVIPTTLTSVLLTTTSTTSTSYTSTSTGFLNMIQTVFQLVTDPLLASLSVELILFDQTPSYTATATQTTITGTQTNINTIPYLLSLGVTVSVTNTIAVTQIVATEVQILTSVVNVAFNLISTVVNLLTIINGLPTILPGPSGTSTVGPTRTVTVTVTTTIIGINLLGQKSLIKRTYVTEILEPTSAYNTPTSTIPMKTPTQLRRQPNWRIGMW